MRLVFLLRAAGVAASLLAAAFMTFLSLPSTRAEPIKPTPAISVNRALKGDRLRLFEPAMRQRELELPASGQPMRARRKVPFGCDAAFSPVAAPLRAHVFGRCMA